MTKTFTKKELLKVEELAKTKTFAEIAREFGMSDSSFKNLRKKQPELKEAAEKGKSERIVHPNAAKLKKSDRKFSKKELLKIEELAATCSYVEISKEFGISENKFLELRQKDVKLKEAVARGVAKRGKDFNKLQRQKRSEQIKQGKVSTEQPKVQLSYFGQEENVALRKFREEFERKKLEISIKELKEVDLI